MEQAWKPYNKSTDGYTIDAGIVLHEYVNKDYCLFGQG